jgi:hypothetical protein
MSVAPSLESIMTAMHAIRSKTRIRPARHGHALFRHLRTAGTTLLLLLAGAVFSLAIARPPANPNIQLDIQNHASSGSDGYTNTTASNGSIYSYRYSGGEGSGGDVVFRTRGRVTVNVHLGDGRNYSIEDVSFTGDTHQQLRWLSSSEASSIAVIQDKNDQTQTAQYKITVLDKNSEVSIPCDPMIANRG